MCTLQVFGVNEQETVCASRLAVAEQRESLPSQKSGMGGRGKPARMETEVQDPKAFKLDRCLKTIIYQHISSLCAGAI